MKNLDKSIFSTGEISKLVRVAPRTVSNWIDTNKLKGYRLPSGTSTKTKSRKDAGKDRRVLREELAKFLAANNMPTLEKLIELYNSEQAKIANASNF